MSNKKNSVESSFLQSKYSKPEPHYKVFSSYKPVLLFHDLTILLLSFVLTLQRKLRFFEKFTHTPFSVGKIGAMVSRLNPTDLADQGFQALPFHW